jgi:hypothetical protein
MNVLMEVMIATKTALLATTLLDLLLVLVTLASREVELFVKVR